jgi:hypothetical protein
MQGSEKSALIKAPIENREICRIIVTVTPKQIDTGECR